MVIALVFACVVAAAGVASAAMLWMERTRMARSAQEARDDAARARSEIGALRDAAGEAQRAAAALEARLGESQEREKREAERFQEQIRTLKESFNSLAGDALKHSNAQFLELAKQAFEKHHERTNASVEEKQKAVDALLKPIQEALKKTDEKLGAMEKERVGAYEGLLAQVRQMQESGRLLTERTGDLVKALRKPQVRGRYGEIQLERVVEVAGMRPYCDFTTQSSSRDDEGRLQRPDMVVRLPNGRVVIVDAKCNIEAYLDAVEADDDVTQSAHLDRFARHVVEQVKKLSDKEYWKTDAGSAEFVVMFVPGDQFVDAALERRPELLEAAAQQGVIIASPSTLIGLLRAVHVGWREKSLSDNARELFTLGAELHERVGKVVEYIGSLGKAIDAARDRYNKVVGSVETRLMPTLRRFEEKGAASSKAIDEVKPLEGVTRLPALPVGDEISERE
jgi:DNA recombination protein RmuC